MAETLLESIKDGENKLRAGVIKIITEASPLLKVVPWETISGNAYTYDIEQSLPTLAFRGVGGTYTANTGVINRVTERLTIFGGEVKLDNFQVRTQGNGTNPKARQYAMKARALAIQFSEYFFESDQDVTANSFTGIRRRIGADQIVNAGNAGATLTLAMLDQLVDKVVGSGDGDTALWLNKTLRRKITALGLAGNSGGMPFIDIGDSKFGHQVTQYNKVPLMVVERDDNESTFLDFDEDDADAGGGNLDTASIYMTRMGSEFISGIQGAGGSMEVHDFGEMQAEPSHLGRIEWYPGLIKPHPRSAARLIHVNNA